MLGNKQIVSTLCILVLGFAAALSAQEKRIKKADLPSAVQKAADEQSKGAAIRGYTSETEEGKLEDSRRKRTWPAY